MAKDIDRISLSPSSVAPEGRGLQPRDPLRDFFLTLDRKISDLTDGRLYAAVAVSLLLISAADIWVAGEASLALFYLFPVGLASWKRGIRLGVPLSLVAIFPLLAGWRPAVHGWQAVWEGGLFFGFMAATAILLDAFHRELLCTRAAFSESDSDRRRAEFVSRHDSLTGLPNRAAFHAELKERIVAAQRTGEGFQILFLDIDHFKQINDSLGHYAGDLLLKGVAAALQSCIDPERDLLARLSGDEFGIICRRPPQAPPLAAELIEVLSSPVRVEGQDIVATVSIGVASYPGDGTDSAQLLMSADLAMYDAKGSGRATFAVYRKSMETRAKRRGTIKRALSEALARGTLELHYQPIFRPGPARLCAAEALLRLPDSGIPLLSTVEMVAVAEETGLIRDVGIWVLRSACAQAREWHRRHWPLHVAINLSSQQLRQASFLPEVDRALAETGIDPACLELEITERVFMENTEENLSALRALKTRGIRIAVDDFGTGFSSLGYLKNFPVDVLKIDQFFVKGLPQDRQDKAITGAIIALARGLRLHVVAEGVENAQQMAFLEASDCDSFQGNFLAAPMSAPMLTGMLLDGAWSIAPLHPPFDEERVAGLDGKGRRGGGFSEKR